LYYQSTLYSSTCGCEAKTLTIKTKSDFQPLYVFAYNTQIQAQSKIKHNSFRHTISVCILYAPVNSRTILAVASVRTRKRTTDNFDTAVDPTQRNPEIQDSQSYSPTSVQLYTMKKEVCSQHKERAVFHVIGLPRKQNHIPIYACDSRPTQIIELLNLQVM
jgi:hypothetical protein